MTINFPTSLDSLSNPTPPGAGQYVWLDGTVRDSMVDPATILVGSNAALVHSTQHANANDAIEALEAKLGIDGSAVTTSIDYLLKSASSVNPGHKHTGAGFSGFTDTQILYGNSSGGVSSSSAFTWNDSTKVLLFNASGPTVAFQYGSVDSAKILVTTTAFTIQGYTVSAGDVGQSLFLKGGAGVGTDKSGGFLRLTGGPVGAGGDSGANGFTTTGTSVSSFSATALIGGSLIAGNTINDFAVTGTFYGASSVICVGGIGLGGKFCPAGYSILGTGDSAQIMGLDRAVSGAGANLTIQAGWAQSSTSNTAGGNLFIASGVSTGNAATSVAIQASGGGSSGSTDKVATTVATFSTSLVTFIPSLNLRANSTTSGTYPLKFDTSGTVMATALAGAVECAADKLFFTIATGSVRKEIALREAAGSANRILIDGTNGRITNNVGLTFASSTLTTPDIIVSNLSGDVLVYKNSGTNKLADGPGWDGTTMSFGTAGQGFSFKEGSGTGYSGQTALVTGTKALTISGIDSTTHRVGYITRGALNGGTAGTGGITAIITTNTLTLTSVSILGVTQTADVGTVNYRVDRFN